MRRRLEAALYGFAYGLTARFEAFTHLLRNHDLRWRGDCFDWWTGHTGCITCEACPDASPDSTGVAFWTRYNVVLAWIGRTVCAYLGHGERKHPQTMTWDEDENEPTYVDIPDKWYCYRCLSDLPE